MYKLIDVLVNKAVVLATVIPTLIPLYKGAEINQILIARCLKKEKIILK